MATDVVVSRGRCGTRGCLKKTSCGCGGLWLLLRVPTTPHLLLLERSSSVTHSPVRESGPASAGGDGAGEAPSARRGNGA